jgi:hypothetical protein
MGTRNLTVVIQKEKPKIAQYGQWDGYPEGNGVKILDFVRKKKNIEKLKANLKRVRFSNRKDEKELKEWMKNMGCENGWMNMDQAEAYHKRFPYLTRDLGAGILEAVAESKDEKIVLNNSIDFAGDSLFCEWAYVIDLDKNQLEVYTGFNKSPLGEDERFANIKPSDNTSGYLGIRFLQKFDLDKLPTKAKFLSSLKKKEKETADVE